MEDMVNHSLVGTHVGNIRLESRLGAGGMGEVYLGYDARLDRRVAVKTIRSEHRFDSEMKSRFLREARILSKLEHPAICQVYDLVEGEKADFLIFEFVEGRTLKQVMNDGLIEPRRALEIAEKIAEALAAAHRERIVHRDLKPENIMVTVDGAVKVLDFGISRAVKEGIRDAGGAHELEAVDADPERTRAVTRPLALAKEASDAEPTQRLPSTGSTTTITLDADLTQRGFVMGTVRYMSPEQARGEETTEPSDLYSFGILLREMFTGKAAYAGGLAAAEMVLEVAAARTLPLEGLDEDLMALLERLQSAAPPTRPTAIETAERLRALLEKPERLRRQRMRLALAAGAFLFLVAVLVVVSVLAVKARKEAERANREAERANNEARRAGLEAARARLEAQNARQVIDFVVELFDEAGPSGSRGRALTALEVVDRGAAGVSSRFADQPLAKALFQKAIGQLYWQLGNYPAAEVQLEASIAGFEQAAGGDGIELARGRGVLANIKADQGEWQEATQLFEKAIAACEAGAPDTTDLASLLSDFGALRWRQGDLEGARPLFERAMRIDEAVLGSASLELASRRNNLAILTWQLGDLPRAQELFEQALANKEKLEGQDHPDMVALLNNLGILLREQGAADEAEALHGRALDIGARVLGEQHPDLASVWYSLGRALAVLGRSPEAIAAFRKAVEIHRAARGDAFFEIGRALVQIGDLERQSGNLAAAASRLEEAQRVLERSVGQDHPAMQECREAQARLAKEKANLGKAPFAKTRTLSPRTSDPSKPIGAFR